MRKFLFLFLSVVGAQSTLAVNVALAIDFSCVVTGENKKYEDVFLVQLRVNGVSSLSHQRLGIDGYSELKLVDGCHNLRPFPISDRSDMISIECDNDGEDGFVEFSSKTGVGEIYFYKPKLGYGERTSLEINCTER